MTIKLIKSFIVSLLLITLLTACESKPVGNVFPVNVPPPATITTTAIYCVNNASEYIHVEFDGVNYIATDEYSNVTLYPTTAKVAQGKCQ